MGMGLMIVALYLGVFSQAVSVGLLAVAFLAISTVEVVRLRNPSLNEKLVSRFGMIIRASEVNRVSGTPYYVGAALLSVALFPKAIAALSILYLACGDPIASLVGILFGKHGPRFASGKTLIGTAAGVFTCFMVSLAYLLASGVSGAQLLVLSFIGGVAGGAAELLPVDVDDNFSIPVVSGFALWMGHIFLGL